MAKLFILTKEQMENGHRPKTPRDKLKNWRKICIILTLLVIVEHVTLYYWWK